MECKNTFQFIYIFIETHARFLVSYISIKKDNKIEYMSHIKKKCYNTPHKHTLSMCEGRKTGWHASMEIKWQKIFGSIFSESNRM